MKGKEMPGRTANVRNKPAAKPAAEKASKPRTQYGEREDGSLSGNLTRDPELRFTASGRPVVNTAVAINERIKNDETGEWEDTEPEFYDIIIWGQQAENAAEYLSRGDRIVAVGYFQDETYENKEGEEVTRTRFTAKDIGPSLLWHGAKIIKAQRNGKSS